MVKVWKNLHLLETLQRRKLGTLEPGDVRFRTPAKGRRERQKGEERGKIERKEKERRERRKKEEEGERKQKKSGLSKKNDELAGELEDNSRHPCLLQ